MSRLISMPGLPRRGKKQVLACVRCLHFFSQAPIDPAVILSLYR